MFPQEPKNKKIVYLDNAAATSCSRDVFDAMKPYFQEKYGNPSAFYSIGVTARKAIEDSRKTVADLLHAQPDTIIFTSGGTESINLGILGFARKHKNAGKHIITTKVEHHAVLNTLRHLEKEGFEITFLNVDKEGYINLDEFRDALRKDTILISIMYANNEIGTILPIADIGREILKRRKDCKSLYPFFHTDACQAPSYLDLDVEKLHVDLMSLNGSKIYGPKGSGLLYKRRGLEINPIMYGGGQEMSLCPGTENIAGIVGFSKALELAQKNINSKEVEDVRNYFWDQIKNNISDVEINGVDLDSKNRLPNNLNVQFKGVEVDSLIMYMDKYGVICSSGSACTSDSDEASHVLQACGVDNENIKSSVRFTLSCDTTLEDIDYVMKYLPEVVKELRLNKVISD